MCRNDEMEGWGLDLKGLFPLNVLHSGDGGGGVVRVDDKVG